MKLKKSINYKKRSQYKEQLVMKMFDQRPVEQHDNSGDSLQNAKLKEVPSLVVIVEGCFEAPLFLRNRHLHLFLLGFWLILLPPKKRGSRRLLEPQILTQESRGSSFPHAQKLPPSFAFLQVGSLSWVLVSYDARWKPFASLPPYAKLGLWRPFVPEKLHRLFFALEFVLDCAKTLQKTWGCCFGMKFIQVS